MPTGQVPSARHTVTLIALLAVLALSPLPGGAAAERGAGQLFPGGDAGKEERAPGNVPPAQDEMNKDWVEKLQEGWGDFGTFRVVEMLVALVLATVLASFIAYHPRSYGKASTLEEAEQPKIFLMYSIIGAIVAQLVKVQPEMALVVFGLGGLFRFRTDVGPAKDTGRVILVTCIGLCCGLKIFVVAVIGTAFGWGLIYFLEGRIAHRIVVKGIEPALLAKSAEAYHDVLRENGLTIMSEKKNFLKGQVAFVFRAPGRLDREALELLFKDIPPKHQGAVDWESS